MDKSETKPTETKRAEDTDDPGTQPAGVLEWWEDGADPEVAGIWTGEWWERSYQQ